MSLYPNQELFAQWLAVLKAFLQPKTHKALAARLNLLPVPLSRWLKAPNFIHHFCWIKQYLRRAWLPFKLGPSHLWGVQLWGVQLWGVQLWSPQSDALRFIAPHPQAFVLTAQAAPATPSSPHPNRQSPILKSSISNPQIANRQSSNPQSQIPKSPKPQCRFLPLSH